MSNRQLVGYTASSAKPYLYAELFLGACAATVALCWLTTHLAVPAALGWLDELDHLDVFGTDDLS